MVYSQYQQLMEVLLTRPGAIKLISFPLLPLRRCTEEELGERRKGPKFPHHAAAMQGKRHGFLHNSKLNESELINDDGRKRTNSESIYKSLYNFQSSKGFLNELLHAAVSVKGRHSSCIMILFIHAGLHYNHQCHVKSNNNGFPYLLDIAYVFLKAGYISFPRSHSA